MAHRIRIDGGETLEDLLAPGLDLWICGYNPHPYSVAQGHYYARRANRFWEDLHESGLVPEVWRGPGEDRLVLDHGIGLTDLVKRPTCSASEVSEAEFRAGIERLDALLRAFRPRMLAFNGLGLGARYARHGRPPEGLSVWTLPSSSPRNQRLREARLEAYRALNAAWRALPGRSPPPGTPSG